LAFQDRQSTVDANKGRLGLSHNIDSVVGFVKRRDQPVPGSIPAALDMFRAEVRLM
jgi:hypothetical protein